MKPAIDPRLQQALLEHCEPLSIFATLKCVGRQKSATASAKSVVTRVAKKTQESPQYHFRDLDSVLHVSANRGFIEELLRQPEIVDASMVPAGGSAMIEPVNRREVTAAKIAAPVYPRRRVAATTRS